MVSSINHSGLISGLMSQPQSKVANPQRALTESLAKAMPGVIKLTDKQSPETTAQNILQHVKNGLDNLRAQGASDARLEERWKAAQEGIEKGYKEATEMLKGLGLYDQTLEQEVTAGRKLVDEGMATLLKNIRSPEQEKTHSLSVGKSTSLAMKNSFSLEIVTRQGDRVSVNFAQSSQASDGLFAKQAGYQMQVQGHLSEDEKNALGELFKDVQNLAERFFNGDIGGALGDAMELGFDSKRLASMSLNLTQTLDVSRNIPYSAVRDELPTAQLESLKAPLASYVDSYMKAVKKAEIVLPAVPQTIQALMERMLPEDARLSIWQQFHQGLNDVLAQQNQK